MEDNRMDREPKDSRETKLINIIKVTIMEDYDLRPSTARDLAVKAVGMIVGYIETEGDSRK